MKKNILLFFILIFSISLLPNKIEAASTNKNEFPYEITSITMDSETITVKGWGMVVNKHHYDSVNSHYYTLVLQSENGKLTYSSKPIYHSQTNTMRYLGVGKCAQNAYYQRGTTCYYNYDYVGFEFKIPLQDLSINETYESKLFVHSNILGFSLASDVFYPILTPIIQMNDKIEYKVTSNLYDTSLQVADFGVFDRIYPSKDSKIRQTTSICDASFGHNRYFEKGSIYLNVFDRFANESTIFYKVKTGSSTICKLGRNSIREGNQYDSWIAGNWVDFSGEPMKIKVTDTNQPPQIIIQYHPTITNVQVADFNFKDYIQSLDPEDGDITYKTILLNEVDLRAVGTYYLQLEVEDSNHKKANETLIVKVIDGNTPPYINAYDRTIYQYEKYEYLQNVSAYDQEDGNITQNITYEGNVDTNRLGTYHVTYYVLDSKNKIATKTIQVHVIKNPKEKIRYISNKSELLFYKQNIPINWKESFDYLVDQIENPKVFITHKFKN